MRLHERGILAYVAQVKHDGGTIAGNGEIVMNLVDTVLRRAEAGDIALMDIGNEMLSALGKAFGPLDVASAAVAGVISGLCAGVAFEWSREQHAA